MFSERTIEEIRSRVDLVELIGEYIELKKSGTSYKGLCPFHGEKTPSFMVQSQKQIFHCFGCHKGGDVFTFIQEYESISFTEAVRRLAERSKIPLEIDEQSGQQQSRFVKESLLQIHEQISQRWHATLLNDAAGESARSYLAKRGVTDEAVKLFRLGCAPEAWDDTVNWAKSKGHDLALVEQAGLIIRKEGETRYYDRFRGRLMFPICDEQGRVIGFSGRILAGDEKAAKYVNSPETPIFSKGKIFFGLDKSKRALLDAQCAIICEGQLDLIACYMAGVRNIVAPQGTAFTADHARILKRYVDEVVLCFDSDSAGQSAAVRVLDSLLASGLAIRVAAIPEPHDPDSFIKEFGGPAFQQLIAQAEEFFDYYLKRLCAIHDIRSDKGQLAVVHAMAESVQKTGNLVLADKYAQKTALRLGVAPDSTRQEFKKANRKAPKAQQRPDEEPPAATAAAPRPTTQEFWLLKLVLLHDEAVEWVQQHLDASWLQHPHVREIIARRLALQLKSGHFEPADLLAVCEDPSARALITEALAENRPIPNQLQQIKDLVARLRNQFIDQQLTALLHRVGDPAIADAERIAILERQKELRALKSQALIAKS